MPHSTADSESSDERCSFSRRRFLTLAALFGATACLHNKIDPAKLMKDKAKMTHPLFRFVQWNDQHVQPGSSAYPLANEKQRYLVEALKQGIPVPTPDFVISCGDMVNCSSIKEWSQDFVCFKEIIASLPCPHYPVIGNHEDVQGEGNAELEKRYCDAFGADRLNYAFEHGGILFIAMNDSGTPMSNDNGVSTRRNGWLRDVLERKPSMPKIICCHIPIKCMREEAVLKDSFGFVSYITKDTELESLIDSHSDTIIAVLSGHLHLTGMVQRNSIFHIVTSGTASYPCDWASYEVFADRIHVRMHTIPQELITPQSDIHGRPRFKIDYTDSVHPTHEAYMKGNPEERDFVILLTGKKKLR